MDVAPGDAVGTLVTLVLLVVTPLLIWAFTGRVRRQDTAMLRPLSPLDTLHGLLARAAESGRRVHLLLGSAGVGDAHAAVASVGLSALRFLARQGVSLRQAPTVTVADPVLMLLAQDTLYRAYHEAGAGDDYNPTDVQMVAPNPTAYAVGAQDIVDDESVAANVMIGHFGEEYLLIGEAGAQRGTVKAVGSDAVNAQPMMYATAEQVLLGEQVFALPAYLDRRPTHIAALQVQDALRVGAVIVILAGVLIKTVLG